MLISLSMTVIWCFSIFANIDRIAFVRLVSTITTKLKTTTTPQKTTTTKQNNNNTKQTITYKQTNDLQTPQQNDSDNNIPLFETDYFFCFFFLLQTVCVALHLTTIYAAHPCRVRILQTLYT